MIPTSGLDLSGKVKMESFRSGIFNHVGRHTAVRTRQSSFVRYRNAFVSSFIARSPCKFDNEKLSGLQRGRGAARWEIRCCKTRCLPRLRDNFCALCFFSITIGRVLSFGATLGINCTVKDQSIKRERCGTW